MTFSQLASALSMREFLEWAAYYKIQAEEVEDSMSKQRALSRANKGFHR